MCRAYIGCAANAAGLLRNAYERTNKSDRHRHPYSVKVSAALKRLFLTLRYIISENYMETCTSCGDSCSSLQQFLLNLHAGAVKTTLVCRGLKAESRENGQVQRFIVIQGSYASRTVVLVKLHILVIFFALKHSKK